jgi:acid stress-induced BolA-like protein IbaG/YrbA
MSLELINPAQETSEKLRSAIATALPDAVIEVKSGGPGHYELVVVSELFEGKSLVKKQQLVYAAIADLMKGDNAPVHAIDRLQARLP